MTTTATAPEQASPPAPAAPTDPDAILRARRAPHAAVGALVVAAAAARLAADVTGDEQVVATWTATAAFVIAVVAATRVRRRVFDKRALRRAWAFLGVAVAWLTTVAATGLTMGAVGVLMAVGYGLALHWWRLHPIGPLPERPEPIAPYAQRWAENVGVKDGALPGSRLTRQQIIKAGVRYTLMLRPGRQSLETFTGAVSKIRGGLELRPDQEMIVEPHPTLPEPHLQLTIVTKSPVRSGVEHPGAKAFDPETGLVSLGPYTDGEGTAHWRVYADNSMYGGFIQGGTRSGKSRMIESIALAVGASESHPTVVLYADGQQGASSPTLMRYSDYFAGLAERILAMVAGMELVMQLRLRENIELEVEGFTPTVSRPGLLGILDECHKALLKSQNPLYWEATQRICATIAKEGGKVGVVLLLASQEPTLDAFGGAGTDYCEALRSNLLIGNAIVLAGYNPNTKTVFGVDVNPRTFPTGGGYGYVARPVPGDRAAMFRGNYLTDRMRETWAPRIRWRELPPAASAIFPGYRERERTYAERKAMVNGSPLTANSSTTTARTMAPADAVETFGTLAFPSWAEMEKAARQEAERAIGPNHQRVLDAVLGGAKKPSQIAEVTGYSVRQVHNLLDDLLLATRVQKVVPPGKTLGWYEPVAAAA